MAKSFLIKLSAALVAAVYVLSFVGINVHSCDCTGHVCVTLAVIQHDIHADEHCHDHGHNHACAHHLCHHNDGVGSGECCHNKIFKITVSGDSEHNDHVNVNLPSVDIFYPSEQGSFAAKPALNHQRLCFADSSPQSKDILTRICIMRV